MGELIPFPTKGRMKVVPVQTQQIGSAWYYSELERLRRAIAEHPAGKDKKND